MRIFYQEVHLLLSEMVLNLNPGWKVGRVSNVGGHLKRTLDLSLTEICLRSHI